MSIFCFERKRKICMPFTIVISSNQTFKLQRSSIVSRKIRYVTEKQTFCLKIIANQSSVHAKRNNDVINEVNDFLKNKIELLIRATRR